MDLGYHLCYGSPADEHLVMPEDMAILVEMSNGLASRLQRRLDFLHLPVPKDRTDRDYFIPLEGLQLPNSASLILGLIHHEDAGGDVARISAAREFLPPSARPPASAAGGGLIQPGFRACWRATGGRWSTSTGS